VAVMRHGVLMVERWWPLTPISSMTFERQRFLIDLDPSRTARRTYRAISLSDDDLQRREGGLRSPGDRTVPKPNRACHHCTVHRKSLSRLQPESRACMRSFTAVDTGWTAVVLGNELAPRGEQRHALRSPVAEKH